MVIMHAKPDSGQTFKKLHLKVSPAQLDVSAFPIDIMYPGGSSELGKWTQLYLGLQECSFRGVCPWTFAQDSKQQQHFFFQLHPRASFKWGQAQENNSFFVLGAAPLTLTAALILN